MRELTAFVGLPIAHVIVVCANQPDEVEKQRLSDLCRECGRHHDVSLIWHPPLGTSTTLVNDSRRPRSADDLASTIADEVARHDPGTAEPSFATHSFLPG